MENEFAKVMSPKTDDDLISIITIERGNYQLLAVEAAEQEIERRNIDPHTFETIKAGLNLLYEQKIIAEQIHVGLDSRFFNLIIDMFVIILMCSLVLKALPIVMISIDLESETFIVATLSLIHIYFGYYILLEHHYQKTVGKFLTKTKVVGLNGQKPDLATIIKRTFCRLIPFNKISFLVGTNGFHDAFSDTRVVNNSAQEITPQKPL